MDRRSLLAGARKLSKKDLDVLAKKNADYNSDHDALSTFKLVEVLTQGRKCPHCHKPNPITALEGLLIRKADKLQRLFNLVGGRKAKVDESVSDTFSDDGNYTLLGRLLYENS